MRRQRAGSCARAPPALARTTECKPVARAVRQPAICRRTTLAAPAWRVLRAVTPDNRRCRWCPRAAHAPPAPARATERHPAVRAMRPPSTPSPVARAGACGARAACRHHRHRSLSDVTARSTRYAGAASVARPQWPAVAHTPPSRLAPGGARQRRRQRRRESRRGRCRRRSCRRRLGKSSKFEGGGKGARQNLEPEGQHKRAEKWCSNPSAALRGEPEAQARCRPLFVLRDVISRADVKGGGVGLKGPAEHDVRHMVTMPSVDPEGLERRLDCSRAAVGDPQSDAGDLILEDGQGEVQTRREQLHQLLQNPLTADRRAENVRLCSCTKKWVNTCQQVPSCGRFRSDRAEG